MIWFLLGVAPFIFGAIWLAVEDIQAFLFAIGGIAVFAVFAVCMLLICYGGWQMGWFEQCGTFWESMSCS